MHLNMGPSFPDKWGHACVEFALIVGFMMGFIFFIIDIGRISTLRQKMLSLARYGTELQSSGLVEQNIIDDELRHMVQRFNGLNDVDCHVQTGRFLGTPAAPFYFLVHTKIRCRWRDPDSFRVLKFPFEFEEEVVIQQSAIEGNG